MLLVDTLFFLFLAATAATICHRIFTRRRAWRWHQLLSSELSGCCDSLGFAGCSIICYDLKSQAEIESLLMSSSTRYEVIILLDHTKQHELTETIIRDYRMMRVNSPQRLLHTSTGATLYRSAARNFRRLVVMDTVMEEPLRALNDAIAITSYDYIIPLRSPITLLPHAIGSILVTLSGSNARHIELLYNSTLAECFVFQRDSLILRGGLSHDIIKHIPRNHILHCDIALTLRRFPLKPLPRLVILLTALFPLALCGIVAHLISLQAGIACFCTIVLAIYSARLCLRQWCGENCSVRAILYQIRKLTQFFHSIKFNIS